MELISSTAALIAAAAAAVVGHFVVHDLYEGAPKHAKRILKHAVRMLPEIERERYSEEWLAHLEECASAIGRFRHAIECLLIAWRLRKIFEQRSSLSFEAVELVFSSKGHGIVKVSMNTFTALPVLSVILGVLERKKDNPEKYKPSEEVFQLMADPRVKLDKIYEVRDALAKVRGGTEFDMDLRFVDRFGRPLSDDEFKNWTERQRS